MGNSINSVSSCRLSRDVIADAESTIWLYVSMQISVLEAQKHAVSFQTLDKNICDLDHKIGRYIYELTMKHLTSDSFYQVSLDLEKILKFGNLQKHSYRLMIDMIKETISYLNNIVTSIDGVMLEDICSEDELLSKCRLYCEDILSKYQSELSRASYPLSQTNIRTYNLHRIISEQVSYSVDSYMTGIIEQVKGTVLIEVDQLLCTAIASEVFAVSVDTSTKNLKKAYTVIDSFMTLFDDAKEKFLSLPFPSQSRAIDHAIEEISYKIDTIIRQIQIAYSADKILLQQLTFGINNYYELVEHGYSKQPEDSENISAQDNVHHKNINLNSHDDITTVPQVTFPTSAVKKSRKRDNAAASSSSTATHMNIDDSQQVHDIEKSSKKATKKMTLQDAMADIATPRKRRVKIEA